MERNTGILIIVVGMLMLRKCIKWQTDLWRC